MAFVAPTGYQPIYNPPIPYLGPIYGGVREGTSLCFQGCVLEHMDRFFINLLCGESTSSDIAMHFNPRFDGWDKVVFNTCLNGSWQSEDKILSNPFSKGKPFECVITVTNKGFKIQVDGKEFHTFDHRMPYQKVRAMQVAGGVSIQSINIVGGGDGGNMAGGMGGGYPGGDMSGGYPGGGGGYPGEMGGGYPGDMGGGYPGSGSGGYPGSGSGGYPGGGSGGYPGSGSGCGYPGGVGGGYPGSHLPAMGAQPVFNPRLPYANEIPGGMFPKKTIIIRGMVNRGAKRICFNFAASRSQDIALHINPRVKEGEVVRNSKIGGQWGQEEKEVGMNPFVEGQYFDLSIRCGNHRFKVYVNGQHLFDYGHRLKSFPDIDRLEIEGDAQISYIHY